MTLQTDNGALRGNGRIVLDANKVGRDNGEDTSSSAHVDFQPSFVVGVPNGAALRLPVSRQTAVGEGDRVKCQVE